MLKHKLSKLLADQRLFRFGGEARRVTSRSTKPPEELQRAVRKTASRARQA